MTGRFFMRAQSSDASRTAAAPSVNGVLLPAVIVPAPDLSNTGLRADNFSNVLSRPDVVVLL